MLAKSHPRLAPKPRLFPPVLGYIRNIQKYGLMQFFERCVESHGKILRLSFFFNTLHLVVEPDLVQEVLSKKKLYQKGKVGYDNLRLLLGDGLLVSEGEHWEKHRRLMQPHFRAKSVTKYLNEINEVCRRRLGSWKDGQQVDLQKEMMQLAMDVIGITMFGFDFHEEGMRVGEEITECFEFIATLLRGQKPLPFIPNRGYRKFKKSKKYIDDFIFRTIQRKKAAGPTEDKKLIDVLLHAVDDETGYQMSVEQLRDEICTIFLAGHETTALSMTWFWYLLSQHPDIEERLIREVDEVLEGRMPEVSDIPKLRYTRMCIEEAMRLYPPVSVFPRNAMEDTTLGGYKIAKGSMLLLSPYVTHRDPDHWPNPEVFDPERFSEEAVKERKKSAYLPFGLGPRICMGIHFAMLEMIIMTSSIIQKYRLCLPPGTQATPKFQSTLRPKETLMVTLETRS